MSTLENYILRMLTAQDMTPRELCDLGQVNGLNGLVRIAFDWLENNELIEISRRGDEWADNTYTLNRREVGA